jgi:hypothetical protein
LPILIDPCAQLSPEEKAVLEYQEMEGDTVIMPPNGNTGRKEKLKELAVNIIYKQEVPKYEYKQELALSARTNMLVVYHNPNYAFVPGNFDSFAETYHRTNSGNKLNTEQLKTELESMSNKQVVAHLLPLISFDRRDLLLYVEANRPKVRYF